MDKSNKLSVVDTGANVAITALSCIQSIVSSVGAIARGAEASIVDASLSVIEEKDFSSERMAKVKKTLANLDTLRGIF